MRPYARRREVFLLWAIQRTSYDDKIRPAQVLVVTNDF